MPDRNLLLGIIALQNNFIDRNQLTVAIQAWVRDQDRPVGQILLEQNAVDQSSLGLLEALVDRHLELHDNNPAKSLASLSSIGSLRDELLAMGGGALDATLEFVGVNRDPERDEQRMPPNTSARRFKILRPHAKGGLGTVSIAHDEELHREVALKEIQPRFADDPSSRQRFLREAEITGRLEHPGVVPVYALGHYDDGRPFYAMRFVRGDNLRQAIAAFHESKSGQEPVNFASRESRGLLGRFVDVCDVIDYVHSRGVLHRDLKPGNIMLGKYGETLVVDWGLAKKVERAVPMATDDEATLHPVADRDADATREGSVVGTPAFMSPEQAAGRVDQLGRESDIYSLGATLYCLLTGQPPVTDRDSEVALRKIRDGDIPRPRTIVACIPPALEAICLKAMALSPRDRYRTPGDLAREIESWLADEPVSVYRDSPSERAARWTRRHKGWAQAGSAALLLVAVISVVAVLLVNQARRRSAKSAKDTTTALAKLAIEKTRADDQKDLAIQREKEAARAAEIGRLGTYNAQLMRVRDTWINEPGIALRLLEDIDRCPADLRDFIWGYYYRLLKQDGLRLTGHTHAIQTLAVSPGGRTLVSGDAAGVIKLWDAGFGKLLATVTDHVGPIKDIAFSPDGKWLASADVNTNVKLRDAVTADVVASFTVDAGSTLSLTFSPDSHLLAIGSHGKKISLWDTTTKQVRVAWEAHDSAVEDLEFSPDGELLTSAGRDGMIHTWNVETAQLAQSITHGSPLQAIVFRPDGAMLASAGGDGAIKLWDPTTGQLQASLEGHTEAVTSLAFSSDGNRLASGSIDDSIRVWDVEAKSPLSELRGHLSGVNAVAFAPGDDILVSASHDRTVRTWEVAQQNRNPAETLKGHRFKIAAMALSHDGKTLATAGGVFGETGQVELLLWDLEESRVRASLVGHKDYIQDVKFSPDGSVLASASRDKTIKLWDVQTGKLLRTIEGHAEYVVSIAFSPDGIRLASGTGRDFVAGIPFKVTERIQSELKLWSVARDEELASFAGPFKSTVGHLAFSPDGSLLTSDSNDESILLWDSTTGDLLGALQGGHARSIASVTFAPDGQTLVTASLDGRIVLWDVASRAQTATLEVLIDAIDTAIFSADGKTFATGIRNGNIQFWDPVTTQFRTEIQAHSGSLKSILFSPDGSLVISAGTDQEGTPELKLWRAAFPQGHELRPNSSD